MGRLVRLRAPVQPAADQMLHRLRATRIDQVRHHFDHELGALAPDVRDDTATLITTLTSFEAWDQARHDYGRSEAQVRRAWVAALTKLL
jgi:hypothetical protein